jgi:hypothetical protein
MKSDLSSQVESVPEMSRVCGDLGQGEYDGIMGVMRTVGGSVGGYMSYIGDGVEGGLSTSTWQVEVSPSPTRTIIKVGTMPYRRKKCKHGYVQAEDGLTTIGHSAQNTIY